MFDVGHHAERDKFDACHALRGSNKNMTLLPYGVAVGKYISFAVAGRSFFLEYSDIEYILYRVLKSLLPL
jgi:hypothetical protein